MSECRRYEPKAGGALAALLRHLPLGEAWRAYRTTGKNAWRLFSGFAGGFEDINRALCRLVRELNPYQADQLLPEWEQALGLPDRCLPAAGTIEQRRQWVLFRLRKRRWKTAGDWQALAAIFGLEIRVTPGWLVQKAALYPACYPKRYDLFPKLGRFRVYIDVLNAEFDGYAYEYPVKYGVAMPNFEAFRCVMERIRPANVVIVYNEFPTICGE